MKSRFSWLLPMIVSAPPGVALAVFAATHLAYGWELFLGVPVLMGFLAVLVRTRNNSVPESWVWTSLSPLLACAILMVIWKIEGVICLAMAAPLAAPLAILGGYLALQVRRRENAPTWAACILLAVPLSVFTAPRGPHPGEFRVSSQIVVDAPPETVWNFIYAFPSLETPDELVFRAGLAAPMGSWIAAPGIGAERRCILSTGVMSERITAWDPPRRLGFDVLSTPAAMTEMSPWSDLDPPHLHGFYVSKRGEFKLLPLSGSRTLVEGSSWYQHGLEPAGYWRLWSDYVVRKVQMRVLNHVRNLAEAEYQAKRQSVAQLR